MDIARIARRAPPRPWEGDTKIPWHDPGFSARMLAEHLNQDHDRASRPLDVIDRQVQFLEDKAIGDGRGRVLDLGCGPGLYCAAFARRGHSCCGIDFGPAAIEYARSQDPESEYRLEDLRRADFGTGYDLVLMTFGEFNTFEPVQARELMTKMRDAAFPGGTVVVEVHTQSALAAIGAQAPTWRTLRNSVFADTPHLWFDEHFWFPDEQVCVSRHFVLTEDGSVSAFTSTGQAYQEHEYIELLQNTGFRRIGRFGSLTDDPGLFFLVAGT